MKNSLIFRLVIALSIASHYLQPVPTLAQGKPKARFYCSFSQDGKFTPITLVGIRDSKAEHRQIVRWSDYKNQTAEQRCREGSRRFQAAWDRGEFHKLVAGTANREGIICALSYRQTTCDSTHQLFVLRSAKESKEVIDRLNETMRGTIGSQPTNQSSDSNEIDMQQLIELLSRSTTN